MAMDYSAVYPVNAKLVIQKEACAIYGIIAN